MSRRVRLSTPLFSLVLEVHPEWGTITAFESADCAPLVGWSAELLRDSVARAYTAAFTLPAPAPPLDGEQLVRLEDLP
jgi:hypothetical protein